MKRLLVTALLAVGVVLLAWGFGLVVYAGHR